MASRITHTQEPRIVSLVTDVRVQIVLVLLSLCVIVFYNVVYYPFEVYDGTDLLEVDHSVFVAAVYPGGPADQSDILPGDEIVAIGDHALSGLNIEPPYELSLRAGDTVVYTVRRGHDLLELPVTLESYLVKDIPWTVAVIAMHFLCATFWTTGASLCLFAPPAGVQQRLIGLGWLFAGVAMAAGGPGMGSFAWGAYATMLVSWCCLSAILVIAHLYFPAPSFPTCRRYIVNTLAVVALLLSVLTVFDSYFLYPKHLSIADLTGLRLDHAIYAFLLLSFLASAGLLLRNYALSQEPEVKRQTAILLWGTVLGSTPFFALTLIPAMLFGPDKVYVYGGYTVLFFAVLPLAYAYVVYQRKLLHVDFIINRAVVLFVLTLLVMTVSASTLAIAAKVFRLPAEVSVAGAVAAAAASLPAANLQRGIQKRVNRVLYGCHYDYPSVTSSFSCRLARTVDLDELTRLLVEDLTSQMGIMQSALFLREGDVLEQQQTHAEPFFVGADDELCRVLLNSHTPAYAASLLGSLSSDAQTRWQRLAWAQLFVPIVFETQLSGLLLLGQRRSGVVYSDQDLHIIQTVAHQTALAYANVQLVKTLRGLAQQMVRAGEADRKRIARDLHDTILQQMTFIKQSAGRSGEDYPAFASLLDDSIRTLRQMIKDQRPPLLDQGLAPALGSLVEEMQRLAGPSPVISWHSNLSSQIRLSDEDATTLYRIAQEALVNALKHSNAQHITVVLYGDSDGSVSLRVEDDGAGLPASVQDLWFSRDHYGLVSMHERAVMINAHLQVTSASDEGTTVLVETRP